MDQEFQSRVPRTATHTVMVTVTAVIWLLVVMTLAYLFLT